MAQDPASGPSSQGMVDTARHGDVEAKVFAAQIALLYAIAPVTLRMTVVFSTVMAAAILPVASWGKILAWYLANNLISAVRYTLVARYRRAQPSPEAARQWQWPFVALTALAGTSWGLLGTWLFPADEPTYQAMVLVFLTATAAVGFFSLGSMTVAYAAVCLPMLLPVVVNVLLIGGYANTVLGFGLLMFVVIAISNSRRQQQNTAELLRLRFANAWIAEEREQALRAAEDASRVKSQFLANMSHEIRTPLNGILGMAELLADSALDEQQRFRLDVVRRSGDHLLVLINDILDFSKIEAGKLAMERAPFDLRRTVSDVADLLAPVAHDREITFEVDVDERVPRWVVGDASRVKQVLGNLIGNAIKFTDRGGVWLTISPGEDGRLRFELKDSGVGIAAADMDRIFDAFRQADDSALRRHGGTGLGLTISRQLARAMGGDIECSSEPGKGSVFRFTAELPATEAPEPAAPETATAESGERSHPARVYAGRVLLAEDNAVNALVAKSYLEQFGLAVECVENGRQALERASTGGYDLILMDCQMPEMDGFEATRRIRAHEKALGLEPVPVVALTANAIRGDRERCLEAGMDDYLAKPFRSAELRAIVERHLRRRAESAD